MNSMFAKRLAKLRSELAASEVDAVLAANPANIYYYTGFPGDDSKLLVAGEAVAILTDGRYTEQAAKDCPEIPLLVQGAGKGTWVELLAGWCREHEIRSLAFEGDNLIYNEYVAMQLAMPQVKLMDNGSLISSGRLVKDETELAALREVAALGDRVMMAIERFLKPGITEKELAREIDYAFAGFGAEGLAFPTIVAAGVNGAKPHAKPSDYAFRAGDFVTMDFGGRLHGYCGDMTRTVAIGFADDRHRELYEVVQRAQEYACKNLCVGMTTGDADALARDIIAEAGYGEYFSHSLGHGVGLEIHEEPSLRPGTQTVLQPGHVVTVEPGVYIPDFGGLRIEDTVVMTAKGAEPLTSYPKNLKIF